MDQAKCAEGDASMWRRIFHAEATECVQAMQAVVDSANLNHCASRLEDWRKFDLRATAQMQQHVKEVMQLNDRLEQFLRACASPDEFAKFKGSVVMLTEATEELSAARTDICKSVDAIAERASAKVVAAWEAEVKLSSEVLREHTREQHGRWTGEDARWAKLEAKIAGFQGELGHLNATVQRQADEVDKLRISQCAESKQVSSALQDAVSSIQKAVSSSYKEVAQKVAKDSAANLEAFKRHTQGLLVGDGVTEPDGPRQQTSLGHTLHELDKRMQEWENGTRKDAESWREEADKLRCQFEEQTREAQGDRKTTEEATKKFEDCSQLVDSLKQELEQTKDGLQTARSNSMNNSMKRLKDIEGRGNLKVNRQNGAVTLNKAIEFLPCKPNEDPSGRFANEQESAQVLHDIARMASIFDLAWLELEIRVKIVPKTGTQEFWDKLAECQADAIRDQMEACGYPLERLTVKGTAGNQEPDCVVRLDTSIFAEQPKAKAKAKK